MLCHPSALVLLYQAPSLLRAVNLLVPLHVVAVLLPALLPEVVPRQARASPGSMNRQPQHVGVVLAEVAVVAVVVIEEAVAVVIEDEVVAVEAAIEDVVADVDEAKSFTIFPIPIPRTIILTFPSLMSNSNILHVSWPILVTLRYFCIIFEKSSVSIQVFHLRQFLVIVIHLHPNSNCKPVELYYLRLSTLQPTRKLRLPLPLHRLLNLLLRSH